MSYEIAHVHAFEVLDSRGNPTVACEVQTKDGAKGIAMVPSGASTGTHEALELRDGDESRYMGKGVLSACKNVNEVIAPKIKGIDVRDQAEVDEIMIRLDGTPNKSELGANAILSVSLAVSHAAANASGLPLYRQLQDRDEYELPMTLFNIVNGGAHAVNDLDVQEFKIVPVGANTLHEAVRIGAEIFHTLKKRFSEKGLSVGVGDEGGFAPELKSSEEALQEIIEATKEAGYEPSKDVAIALDVAASEFYKNGMYHFEGKILEPQELTALYEEWIKKYPIISLEDPFDQDAWSEWSSFTEALGDQVQIVGDDLLVTNKKRLDEAIASKACNAVLIKPNQVGTLIETIEVIETAKKSGLHTEMSHRSGETSDTTIADLAVAYETGQIKTGSLSRGERTAKYNRLIMIENELGKNCYLAAPYKKS